EAPCAAAIAGCNDRSVAGRTNNGSFCATRENGGGAADAGRPRPDAGGTRPSHSDNVADTGKRHAGRHQ
ncbi:MAG: hypothetical protein WBE25_21335, partial [Xanthobacteraceae bacterium]